MKVVKINLQGDYAEAVKEAVAVLKKGGSIVVPTDTVYGLLANACDDKAVEQVFRIKKRDSDKPLPVLVRNLAWAREVAVIPTKLEPMLEKLWPGAVTVILPRRPVISKLVSAGEKTFGLRIAAQPLVDRVLAKFGYPVIGTSANLSGYEGADDPEEIRKQFKGEIWQPDLLLDVGKMPSPLPSTVLDFSQIKPRVVRIGALNPAQLEQLLNIKFEL